MNISAGAGDDKIIAGNGLSASNFFEGNGGDDIIYGADGGSYEIIAGDFYGADITANINLGGNDKIYGSNNVQGG